MPKESYLFRNTGKQTLDFAERTLRISAARRLLFLSWHRVMFVDDLPRAILFTKAHGEAELQIGRTAA